VADGCERIQGVLPKCKTVGRGANSAE
jgi:hypothetical protein